MLVKLPDVIDEIGYQHLKDVSTSHAYTPGQYKRAYDRSVRLKAVALLLGDNSVQYSYYDRMNDEESNDLPF